jgi:F-type H+-transporting ATPase subunit epsilon
MAEAIAEKKVELRVIAPTSATDKSPYKYQSRVDMAIMRCSTGDMGILPGRVPVSMVLGTGVLRILDGDSERHMAIMGGIAHVSDDIITILSESAQKPDDISIENVNEELKNFRKLYDETTDLNEKDVYRKEIHRCQIQLDVAATAEK